MGARRLGDEVELGHEGEILIGVGTILFDCSFRCLRAPFEKIVASGLLDGSVLFENNFLVKEDSGDLQMLYVIAFLGRQSILHSGQMRKPILKLTSEFALK